MGAVNRSILHIDMDSFFASCEQQANPALRGVPIAVSGDPKSRTVVAAASKEAKRFGVRSAMTIGDARALCPQIQFVLGDPDKYVEVSRRVIRMLESFTPDVEVTSIDEAFLDVAGWCECYACAECRAATPSSSPSYQEGEKNILCGAVRLAQEIKRRIRDEAGEWITCSIGIAPNKRLAKLASEFKKPDGLVLVYTDDLSMIHTVANPARHCEVAAEVMSLQCMDGIATSLRCGSAPRNDREEIVRSMGRYHVLSHSDLLASLKLRDLCGIGARIEARLLGMGITTIGALAAAPLERLVGEFGSYGRELHDMALGHDTSPVRSEDAAPKSMGHATTLPKDLRTLDEIRPVVEELAEKVAARLRHHGYRAETIHVVLRFRDFTSRNEQTTISDATDDGLRISREVMRILGGWSERRGGVPSPPKGDHDRPSLRPGRERTWRCAKPVRLVGVSVGKLVRRNSEQSSLFVKDRRWSAVTRALDRVNDRYGEWTVQRASLIASERVLRKVAAAFRATSHLKERR